MRGPTLAGGPIRGPGGARLYFFGRAFAALAGVMGAARASAEGFGPAESAVIGVGAFALLALVMRTLMRRYNRVVAEREIEEPDIPLPPRRPSARSRPRRSGRRLLADAEDPLADDPDS